MWHTCRSPAGTTGAGGDSGSFGSDASRLREITPEPSHARGAQKISRARGAGALILSSMFRFAAALTLAVASALAAAFAPAAPAAIAPAAAAFGGLRG